jgi:hypothetical protein
MGSRMPSYYAECEKCVWWARTPGISIFKMFHCLKGLHWSKFWVCGHFIYSGKCSETSEMKAKTGFHKCWFHHVLWANRCVVFVCLKRRVAVRTFLVEMLHCHLKELRVSVIWTLVTARTLTLLGRINKKRVYRFCKQTCRYVDEIIGYRQGGFRHDGSGVGQIFYVRQILEKMGVHSSSTSGIYWP